MEHFTLQSVGASFKKWGHNTMVACCGRETMEERCYNVESSGKLVTATFLSQQSGKIGSITFHCGCGNGTTTAENIMD
jgi:hypothetical protein